MNVFFNIYLVNVTNEKRIVLSSLALLVDSKIKCPMLVFSFILILYGDCAPAFYLFLTIDLFAMDPHIIFITPTLKQSPKTMFIASWTLNLQFNRMSSVVSSYFFRLCFRSFRFYYFVWNINPMHSNSTIHHNEWADGAHYFHIASVNKIDKAHLCAMKEQTTTGSSIKIKSEQNRKSHTKWMQAQQHLNRK